ncbi:MAG TPA: gamma-glutamyl-gamma-aminobutyrate hydrolase family protein [Candidatus Binatia bacterium]|nr:gamma-glutamyl-gamma-aminobutyrate hydrolase family protein [Candidatus Binatia bacterium]
MRPLIGISSYGRAGERQTFSIPCEYVDVVRAVGGVPLVLPPVDGEVPEGLDAVDGLILPGGGDVDPAHYGGGHHEANYGISAERDRFELTLARLAVTRPQLPLLCVCRGMQLLNVALGGDLIAHIPDHFGEAVVHRAPALKPCTHDVRIDADSRLGRVLGSEALSVQSIHHQAVGRLGRDLRAVAWSPDGVVEAIESEVHPFVVGVQWHPELEALSNPRPLRLFEALVDQARRRRCGG